MGENKDFRTRRWLLRFLAKVSGVTRQFVNDYGVTVKVLSRLSVVLLYSRILWVSQDTHISESVYLFLLYVNIVLFQVKVWVGDYWFKLVFINSNCLLKNFNNYYRLKVEKNIDKNKLALYYKNRLKVESEVWIWRKVSEESKIC